MPGGFDSGFAGLTLRHSHFPCPGEAGHFRRGGFASPTRCARSESDYSYPTDDKPYRSHRSYTTYIYSPELICYHGMRRHISSPAVRVPRHMRKDASASELTEAHGCAPPAKRQTFLSCVHIRLLQCRCPTFRENGFPSYYRKTSAILFTASMGYLLPMEFCFFNEDYRINCKIRQVFSSQRQYTHYLKQGTYTHSIFQCT